MIYLILFQFAVILFLGWMVYTLRRRLFRVKQTLWAAETNGSTLSHEAYVANRRFKLFVGALWAVILFKAWQNYRNSK